MAGERRPNEFFQDIYTVSFDHAQLTSTTTTKVYQAPPTGGQRRVKSVRYVNPTGLAQSGSNSFAITLQKGVTAVANGIDTATVAIPADTFIGMTVVDAAAVLDPLDVLSVVATETGTATLPPGRLVIELITV